MSGLQLLLSLFITTCLLHSSSSANYGKRCMRSTCRQNRGYIFYKRPRQSAITHWDLLSQNGQYTTFVLHLRDIQNRNTGRSWLRITQLGYRDETYVISSNEDRVIVFEDTSEVRIEVIRYDNLQFRLDYFTGCRVVEGGNVTIERKRPAPVTTPSPQASFSFYYYWYQSQTINTPATTPEPSCWFVIPVIEAKQPASQGSFLDILQNIGSIYLQGNSQNHLSISQTEVEETYITIQNASLRNESILNVTDLITGNEVISVVGDENIAIATLAKSDRVTKYNRNRNISTFIFVDLVCEDDPSCMDTEFLLTANALQQSDLDCIERERKCRFNIGKKEYDDCEPPTMSPIENILSTNMSQLQSSNCPAFNLILSNVLLTLEATGGSQSGFGRDETLLDNCFDFEGYCSGVQCIVFEETDCHLACFTIKHHMRLCGYFHSIF